MPSDCTTASSSSTSISDHRSTRYVAYKTHSQKQDSSMSTCARWAITSSSSTAEADWAWTTTAHGRPTRRARSTTPSRSISTTASTRLSTSPTATTSPTPTSSPKADARSRPTTPCSSSTCSALPPCRRCRKNSRQRKTTTNSSKTCTRYGTTSTPSRCWRTGTTPTRYERTVLTSLPTAWSTSRPAHR